MKAIRWDRQRVLFAAALAVALFGAYSNTFTAPFIFDDAINIVENSSIRQLWPPWMPFDIPPDTGIANRPVVNFTLALNHALSGTDPWSYHAANLGIHILAAFMLFAIMIRIASSPEAVDRYGAAAVPFSFACALLWGLHPIQTQAVSYLSQRCESLMALFILTTCYCALRGWQSEFSRGWHLAAVMSFLLAAFSKEVAAATPLVLLCYEWVFLGRSPFQAVRKSPLLYAGIALGILVLAAMTLQGNTLALRTERSTFAPASYWLTQFPVLAHYLRLMIWPSGLTIDYGWPAATLREAWPAVALIMALALLTAWAVWRRREAGFWGAWFFFFLAPSTLIPLPDVAFEHRMYLPSAAVVILFLGMAFLILGRLKERKEGSPVSQKAPAMPVFITIVLCWGLALGVSTFERNGDYRSEMAIWLDAIQKRPDNFRGYHGVASALSKKGEFGLALAYMNKSIRLNPRNAYAYNDAGCILFALNRPADAIPFFRESVRWKPDNAKAHNNLGAALAQTGQFQEAVHHFSEALRIKSGYSEARNNLKNASAELAGIQAGGAADPPAETRSGR